MKRKQPFYKKTYLCLLSFILPVTLFLSGVFCLPARADITDPADRKQVPIESNLISDWPTGPTIGAQSALVMDASNRVLLYEKNVHQRLYPASTTKLMTCLVAWENSSLTETVTVSPKAVAMVPYDGSRIGLDPGEKLTMEEMLYGIMVGSGNEAANAVAEHVAGSIDAFVEMMNDKAAELGCTDTHFTNPNGLHDDDHYTSAYDLALIARAFFDSVTLSEIGGTARYHFKATPTQPDDFTLKNKHALITGETTSEGVIGGKTGFTDEAGECLVTCAERDGLKLISVVLFEDSPNQFSDSASLLDYGYGFFSRVSMLPYADAVLPARPDFFLPESNLFERPVSTYSFAPGSHVDLPKDADVADTVYEILPSEEKNTDSFSTSNPLPGNLADTGINNSRATNTDSASTNDSISDEATEHNQNITLDTSDNSNEKQTVVARVRYTYHDAFVGGIDVIRKEVTPVPLSMKKVVYINLYEWLFKILLACACVLTPFLIVRGLFLYSRSSDYLRKQRMRRNRKKKSRARAASRKRTSLRR